MKYIYLTKEAAEEFAANQFYQTCDYKQGERLCNVIRTGDAKWSDSRIGLSSTNNGLIFYTEKINRNEALIFDIEKFHGFNPENGEKRSNNQIITIFQKVIKYAVKYFNSQPYGSSEQLLPSKNTTMVFPFPFEPAHDSYKVFVDMNSYAKKGKKLLLVFAEGNIKIEGKPSFTNLNKALEDIKGLEFKLPHDTKNPIADEIEIANLKDVPELKIDSQIGFEHWWNYLTISQKQFIQHIPEGPERLEGGAGTGKTITLALKCIYLLKQHIDSNSDLHIIFFTHSAATCERIKDIIRNNWADATNHFETLNQGRPRQSVLVTTLQEWCSARLGYNQLSDAEFLDKDAAQSKEWQKLYIDESFSLTKAQYWSTFKLICSSNFVSFIDHTPYDRLIDVIQREISEVIKGRTANNLEDYLKLDRSKNSLYLESDAEKKYIFQIFKHYQSLLENNGKYDTDDITISALGQLNTPIWNRRRINDGYDICIVDETQIFNINEVSIFHYVNTLDNKNKIIFALDRSQTIEDIYEAYNTLMPQENDNPVFQNKLSTIFRSSPDIARIAYSILTSGVTLFADYDNPLVGSLIPFTSEEEKKCETPLYKLCLDEYSQIKQAFEWAENYRKSRNEPKSEILFVTANNPILLSLKKYVKDNNKAVEWLQKRSDMNALTKAKSTDRFLVSSIEYVGGLEFSAVVILGVDANTVPPKVNQLSDHIFSYLWHNRLYVTVTRAKYAIAIFGDNSAGPSPILDDALKKNLFDYKDK